MKVEYHDENYVDTKLAKELSKIHRRERFANGIKRAVSVVVFTPLIKIFRLLNLLLKILMGFSAFSFLYACYQLYKKYTGNEIDMTLTIIFLVAPFVLSFFVWLFDFLTEKMEEALS